MSRRPRSDWLGSSTSPPLTRRSNLSFRPIAACVPVIPAVTASEAVEARNARRDSMVVPPVWYFAGCYRPQRRPVEWIVSARYRFVEKFQCADGESLHIGSPVRVAGTQGHRSLNGPGHRYVSMARRITVPISRGAAGAGFAEPPRRAMPLANTARDQQRIRLSRGPQA